MKPSERPERPPGLSGPAGHRRYNSSYWRLLSSTGVSGVGNGMVLVALPLLAVSVTHRPLEVAAVAVAGQLPWLVVAIPAGVVADRVDGRRLVVLVEVLRALLLGALGVAVVTGHTPLPVLYSAAFLGGALETVFSAATGSWVSTLVDPADLPGANGYLLAAQTAGEQFAGPAVGGVIFALSSALPFFGDAVSFAASAGLVSTARGPERRALGRPELSLLGDTKAGLRWFRQQLLLRRLAGVVAVFALCQASVLSVLVLYGLHVLHLTQSRYGFFLAFGAIGDVAGSLLAQRAHDRLGAGRTIVAAGVIAASGYVVLGLTSSKGVALAGYILEAVAVAVGNVATIAWRQRVIPHELFGRVNNIFRTLVYAAMTLGAIAGGAAASLLGLQETFILAGCVQLIWILASSRHLRREMAA